MIILAMFVFTEYAYSNTRTFRVFMLDPPTQATPDLYLFDGIDSTKIELSAASLSPIYELPHGDLNLVLTPRMTSTNDKLPVHAPRAEVDEDVVDILLLLRSDPKNKLIPLEMIVVDISDDKVKAGQTLWLNYTTSTIKAELEENSVVIDPDAQSISEPPLLANGYFTAEFSYRTIEAENFSPIMKKSWWLDRSSKNIGFILNDKRSRLPLIFTLRDKR
jgi:hypothetical protein